MGVGEIQANTMGVGDIQIETVKCCGVRSGGDGVWLPVLYREWGWEWGFRVCFMGPLCKRGPSYGPRLHREPIMLTTDYVESSLSKLIVVHRLDTPGRVHLSAMCQCDQFGNDIYIALL